MHGGEPIHWFLSRTYLKQTKSFNDGSDKYFCCNTTKHNGNSANIIHTQNALQVYERKSAMSWRLIDETTLRIYMRQHFQTNYSNESYRLHMSASFFLMLRTHLQVYTIITWVYLVLWILCKFVETSKQIYLIQTKYTHGGFWRSTRRDLDLKELDVYWAFNLLLNI